MSVTAVQALAGVFILLSGTLAGVLVAVEVAVVPMLARLPGNRYIEVHRLLDPRFDPLMPNINKVALAVGLALIILGRGIPAQVCFGLAEAGIVGVALVSELSNVRINRLMDRWDVTRLPQEWPRLRVRWAQSNRGRTAIALAAFATAIAGTILTRG
jgi:uncharacterized membrane protein